VNGDCPPTDEITPVPGPPPPDCPEAGPELCGEEPPPEDGTGDAGNGEGNDNGEDGDDGTGNGEDGSNGNGDDNEAEENSGLVPPFG
jgi:hypothetical protein